MQFLKAKIIICFALVFMVFSLTSCIRTPSLPYGVWQSENPNMTLFIDRELSTSVTSDWSGIFPGIYMRDGEEVSITIVLESKGGHISIYESVELGDGLIEENLLIRNNYTIENDRLYIRNPEANEFEPIVFELVED